MSSVIWYLSRDGTRALQVERERQTAPAHLKETKGRVREREREILCRMNDALRGRDSHGQSCNSRDNQICPYAIDESSRRSSI